MQFVLTIGSNERYEQPGCGAFLGMTPKRSQSGNTTQSWASVRRVTEHCGACWCNVRTTFWDVADRNRHCVNGAGSWPSGAGRMQTSGRWWPWRKLSVILHRLWRTGEQWKPFPAQ
ncbi:MAG: hypothetical protein KIT83_06260 [Bryobacterales bacterium]|nr:hypothetical protein [Bryobacterales bacterium]